MRILFLQDDFPPESFGGAGISTFEMAQEMAARGHNVSVITTTKDEKDTGTSTYEGVTVYRVLHNDYDGRLRAYRSLRNTFVLKQVEKILKSIKPDVVHANNIHFYISYAVFKVARKYAHTVVFTARDTMSVCYGKLGTRRYLENFDYHTSWVDHIRQAGKRWNPFRNTVIRRYLEYTDRIFTVSDSLRIALTENGVGNVETMHTGIDPHSYVVSENVVENFKEKYAMRNKRVILFGGRVSAEKGGGKIIDALAQIVKRVPEAVLLIAGKRDIYTEELSKRAEKLGVSDALICTGWIDRVNMKVAYSAADVVVVPSLYLDPFPRIVLEAMAAGKPVVGTRYGGAPEAICDTKTGYIVDPRDPLELAGKCVLLLQDDTRAEDFGRAGLLRVREHFHLKDVVDRYIVKYTEYSRLQSIEKK